MYYVLSGTGQMAGVELDSVSGGLSESELGEMRDISAEHFIRFDEQNPETTTDKTLVIKNTTLVSKFQLKVSKTRNLSSLLNENGSDRRSFFKWVFAQNLSHENGFDLHENETACRTHFHMNGFVRRLALKQRHKRTWKWPVMVDLMISLTKYLLCFFFLLTF